MRVTMKTRIGGFRNGQEWPAPGGHLDVPDHEARDLIAAGYAEAAPVPDIDIAKARKAELVDYATQIGVDIDPKAPIAQIRAVLSGDPDAPTPDPGRDRPEPGDSPRLGEGSGEEAVEVDGLNDLDKGQLLDLAADLNISVNPALDTDEIREALAAAGVLGQLVNDDPNLPAAPPIED